MQGIRLADTKLGEFPPLPNGELPLPSEMPPGSYWKVLSRKTGKPMDVLHNEEDRHYWSRSDWDSNLTGGVWGYISPNGLYGMMSVHTVREEDDGTISVRPGDGSSNSILIQGGSEEGSWHGYIEHGVWSEC